MHVILHKYRPGLSEEEINNKITEALYNGTTSFLCMRTGIKTEGKMAMGEKQIINVIENGEDRFSVLGHVDCLLSSVWGQFARVEKL